RDDLSRKMNRLAVGDLDSRSTGDVMSRMTNDTDTVSNSCAESISMTCTSMAMLVGSLVMMFYTEWRLAMFAMVPTAIGFCILYVITHRTQRFFAAQQRDLGRMNGLIEEIYYGHDIVDLYNGREESERRFTEINGSLYHSAFLARFLTGMMPQLMNFISNLGYVIVCVVGSMMIIEGSIGYGVIVAFIVYIRQFTQPISQLADSTAMMQSVASASERVFEFLDLEEMGPSPATVEDGVVRGRVEFRDVRFSYIPGKEVIHGLNLTVELGSKIAIVGPTGSGKTTIANLLMRFYDVDSGDILIDGISISRMSREQVHDVFSMVLQDSWLFKGTVRENIAFTRTDVDDATVMEACEAVGIREFIESLPDRYDTVIDDRSGLSAGQRQQITIARAIVKDAPMTILDEATSSVDTRTEKRIQSAMDRLTRGRTSFVIAHRLSTIRNSDLIIVMKDGDVIESGTHEELLKADGFYRMLYDSQFEGCE
ncbi:MAG: ABC transporter ATP-binding protein, partial [Candidatus Methanomethylophilaceae archaeon]